MQSAGVNYKPTDKQPIWIHVGAVSGIFEKKRGTDTVLTAGITFGYDEKYILKKEEGNF